MHRLLQFLDKPSSALIVEEECSLNRVEVREAIARCRHVLHGRSGRIALEGRPSINFMIWVYAAWSEGLCILPIEPAWPSNRKASLLLWADAGHIDCNAPLPDGLERTAPITQWDETSDAMVLFTSGSSGSPKGLRASAQSLLADLDVRQTPHVPSVFWASVSYSQSAYALVTYVLGHTVLCVDRETWLDQTRIEILARQAGVERVFCTPSYAREAAWLSDPRIHVSLYGERADTALLRNPRWIDCYGQTEGPSLWFAMRRDEGDWKAEPQADLTLLDEDGFEIQERGVIGRLVVRNRHFLATGYLDGEPLADPYDTGDLAEWTEPGCFKLRGRADQMVKLRGFRVELEGIEAVLAASPGVESATVRMYEQNLVAYLAPRDVDLEQVEQSLESSLPKHEIPTRWVTLDALPINRHNKVDRGALPDPTACTNYRAPQTAAETQMCAHWAAVLQVKRVGLDDNFFDLGGHSLIAFRLAELTGYGTGAILSRPTPASLLSTPPVPSIGKPGATSQSDGRIKGFVESLRALMPVPWEPRFNPLLFSIGMTVLRHLSPQETRVWLDIIIPELILQGDASQAHERLRRLFARHPILTARINTSGDLEFPSTVRLEEHILDDRRDLARLKRTMCGLFNRPLAVAVVEKDQTKLVLHHAIFDNRTLEIIADDWKRLCKNADLSPKADPGILQSLFCDLPPHFQGTSGFDFKDVECARVSGPPIAETDVWSAVVIPVVKKLVTHYGKSDGPYSFMLVRDRRFDQDNLEAAELCGPLNVDQVYRVDGERIERTAQVGIDGPNVVRINVIQGNSPKKMKPARWRKSRAIPILVQLGPHHTSWMAPVACLPDDHEPLPPIQSRKNHPRRALAVRLCRLLMR